MFSCARPENDARMRSAPLTRSNIALSLGPCSNGARIISTSSVSARQASGENRSRITDAADCAAPTRNGSAPVKFRCCSTAAATSAGRTFSMSSGTASQAPSSADDVGVDVALGLGAFGRRG